MQESMISVCLQYYSARALFLTAEVTCVFFFSSTLFPAPTFLLLILQTASYTHACWLTLITRGCGVLRSTRVLHTMLKRPGTRSNRLGPDPDPTDHLKYRPKPVRVPGRVPGPPWRPLVSMQLFFFFGPPCCSTAPFTFIQKEQHEHFPKHLLLRSTKKKKKKEILLFCNWTSSLTVSSVTSLHW